MARASPTRQAARVGNFNRHDLDPGPWGWQSALEDLPVEAGTRAEIAILIAPGQETRLDRSLSGFHYSGGREEIELRLAGHGGGAAGPRLFISKPTYVDIEKAPGMTTITVRDRWGSLTTVRLIEDSLEPPGDGSLT